MAVTATTAKPLTNAERQQRHRDKKKADAPAACTLDEIADKIRTHLHRGIDDFLEAGRWLTEAKNRCEHGAWAPWLEREFNLSDRMAQHLMNSYAKFGGKSETISDLRMSVVFLLAAPSTPKEVIEDTIADAKAGKPVTTASVKKKIKKAKQPAAKPKAKEPKPPITTTTTTTEAKPEQDREGARRYAEQLKAQRAAAEAQEQEKPARVEPEKAEPPLDAAERWRLDVARHVGMTEGMLKGWQAEYGDVWKTFPADDQLIGIVGRACSIWDDLFRLVEDNEMLARSHARNPADLPQAPQ
jgi:hypothetical protein